VGKKVQVTARRAPARSVRSLEIAVDASPEGSEALQLELRRLARRHGVDLTVLAVRREGRPHEPSP
jgi:nucleotide-binding universal stress UspA family protein